MPSWPTLSAFEAQDASETQVTRAKPLATPMLATALAFWAGGAATYLACKDIEGAPIGVLAALGVVFALAAAAALWRGVRPILCLAALGLGLGSACGAFAAASLHAQQGGVASEGGAMRIFTVEEDIRYGEFSDSCIAVTELADKTKTRVRLIVRTEGADLKNGDVIRCHVTLRAPSETSGDFYWLQGLSSYASLYSFERVERSDALGALYSFRRAGIAVFERYTGQGAVLLRAVVFGDRTDLADTTLYSAVKSCGLAHLVAVSGAHLNIVVGFIALGLRMLRVPRPVAIALQLGCMLSYVVCTGLAISAIRAACMAAVSMGAFFAKRRYSALSSLGVCIFAILFIDPSTAVSVSFALSALSTLGIVVLGRLLVDWCGLFRFTRTPVVRDGLSLTLASSILALPLSAAVFAQLSLVSPFANILAGPMFGLLCAGGLAVALISLALPPAAGILVPPIVMFAEGFCEGAQALARIPFAAIPWNGEAITSLAFSGVAMLVLWRFWPRFTKKGLLKALSVAASLTLCVIVGSRMTAGNEIIMLDVGQGDAFLVKSRGVNVLIDTGTSDSQLLRGLARHGVVSLDAVIITHADDDHCGSLDALEGIVSVRRVCFAAGVSGCECTSCRKLACSARSLVGEGGVVALERGDSVKAGDFEMRVLWPESFSDEGGNADSLIILAQVAKDSQSGVWKTLFCGDAEAEQLNAVSDSESLQGIDLLKVGHHGSKVALTPELARRLHPKAALVSVGAQNRYGHPSEEVLDILAEIPCEVFRTDAEGDVVCKLDAEKLRIATLG